MLRHHSRLFPWYVGIAVIAAFELVIGLRFFGPACQAQTIPQLLVLVGLPVVYLSLMFLALKSQP